MGDFNFPAINWKSYTTRGSSLASSFLELTSNCSLYQHVLFPTRYRAGNKPSLLDLVFTDSKHNILNIEALPPLGKSDHVTLLFSLNSSRNSAPSPVNRPNYSKADFTHISSMLSSINWEEEFTNISAESSLTILDEFLTDIREALIPYSSSPSTTKLQPAWLTRTVKTAINLKKHAWDRYKTDPNNINHNLFVEARAAASASVLSAKREYEHSLLLNCKNNPKRIFAYINKKQAPKSPKYIYSPSGIPQNTDVSIANEFNAFFHSSNTRHTVTTPSSPCSAPFSINNHITSDEVFASLRALNTTKSPGPDLHHPALLKNCASALSSPLSIIFNKCLVEGSFPRQWKCATVIPIHKGGSTTTPSNYRPISLLPIIAKVFEKFLHHYLTDWLNQHYPLNSVQHGFRKGRSCLSNLLVATEHWSNFLEKKLPCDVIYFDFAKAFDSVPHDVLLNKLKAAGIPEFLYSVLFSYLKDRRQRVRCGTSVSKWTPVTSGVPQGSVLGPLLFLFFINDLPSVLTAFCLLFADDLKIYRPICNANDSRLLQHDIDQVMRWSELNGLSLNESKCKVLHLGTRNHKFIYNLGSKQLEAVLEIRDLGVIVDSNLKFHSQALAAASKARRTGNYIIKSLTSISPTMLKLIITYYVRPHLEYCIQAWRPFYLKSYDLLERTHRYFTKRCYHLSSLPYPDRLSKLGLSSLSTRFDRGDLLLAYKIIKGTDEGLSFGTFFTFATYNQTRGHRYKLKSTPFRTNLRKGIFSQRVVSLWNNLPSSIANATNTNDFKGKFDSMFT
jgi:hypothetical protein